MLKFLDNQQRAFLIPEVVQTSEMDCGPAALKALLDGHDIPVSYGRLREACQTDVDGTSIDVLEDVANQLGLEAEQIIIPTDHIFLSESSTLPAIVIIRLPEGATHFIVIWRRVGNFIQVMDPGTGRRWTTARDILDQLYVHTMPVDRDAWWSWAQSDGFCLPLQERIQLLGISEERAEEIVNIARNSDYWFPLATTDAAVRMTQSIVKANGIDAGSQAEKLVVNLVTSMSDSPEDALNLVPPPFWTVLPNEADDTNSTLIFRGAVMVQVVGVRDAENSVDTSTLSPELRAALETDQRRPEETVLRVLREDGLLAPTMVGIAAAVGAFTVLIEAFLLQGVLYVGDDIATLPERIRFFGGLIAFFIALLFLEFPAAAMTLRLGRNLETRLRIAFLEKIPQLSDRYFHSRLTSDMVSRAHDMRMLRSLPSLGRSIVVTGFQLLFTTIGVAWLDPQSAVLGFIIMGISIGLALATQPLLQEQDLRVRTHNGALSRFYLDALIGLTPLRTHSAERALRRQYEGLLVEWVRSVLNLIRSDLLLTALGSVVGWFFSVWILFSYVGRGGEATSGLLLFYWTLSIPSLGSAIANQIQQYPVMRNRLLRLLEPLDAPNELELHEFPENAVMPVDIPKSNKPGVSVLIDNVTVQAGGQAILRDINLVIKPGEHIAVVGQSGAGKSSLVGLLLGWHFPAEGVVWVDNKMLDVDQLAYMREHTAWVDPDVYLWNRTLFENLTYGTQIVTPNDIGEAIEHANLFDVLKRVSNGLQTQLGEGGGLVSGGEGQRVRLGRALLREDVRLIILDEPFRGLDRGQRYELLARIREFWKDVTIISVTHDVTSTRDFERVIVIDNGQVAEDDKPKNLLEQDSMYRKLYETDIAVNEGLWTSDIWRRLWVADGKIVDRIGTNDEAPT